MTSTTWRKTGVYVLVVLPALGLARNRCDRATAAGRVAAAVHGRPGRRRSPQSARAKEGSAEAQEGLHERGCWALVAATSAARLPTGETRSADAATPRRTATQARTIPNRSRTAKPWRKRFAEQRERSPSGEGTRHSTARAENAQVQYYSDPQKALAEQYTRKDVNRPGCEDRSAKKAEIAKLKQHWDWKRSTGRGIWQLGPQGDPGIGQPYRGKQQTS